MSSTLRDVADRVGVSTATVSRVLRGLQQPRAPELHARILAAARDLGYRASPHAKALQRGRAANIQLLSGVGTSFVSNLKICILLRSLAQLDRSVTHTSTDTVDEVGKWLDRTLAAVPEAIVMLLSSDHWEPDWVIHMCHKFHDEGIRVMVTDYYREELPPDVPCDAMWIDRVAGSRMAVEHLIRHGHRRIGLIAAESLADRRRGYEQALDSHGIADRFYGSWRYEDPDGSFVGQAKRATAQLIAEHPEVSALFCQSDLAAVGAMRAVLEAGLRVPQDVAIVGFDGDPWTEVLPIALTTVVQPVEELCARATQMLAARLGGDDQSWQRIALSPRLVVRESCGAKESGPFVSEAYAPAAELGERRSRLSLELRGDEDR